jgi:prephenate dehydratase
MLVICQIDGQRAGALYEVLKEFAERGINMTRIESRPARTELGAYIFFFDLECLADEVLQREAIRSVAKKSIWLKNLGTFPVLTVK